MCPCHSTPADPAFNPATDDADRAASKTVWQNDIPDSGYHDTSRCRCDRHCRNCFADLDEVISVRVEMIADGRMSAGDALGPRERYCSPYCRNRAKRERALDRALAAITVTPEEGP